MISDLYINPSGTPNIDELDCLIIYHLNSISNND